MNNEIFIKNMEALRESNPELADKIGQGGFPLTEEIEVISEQAKTGEIIFKVKTEDSELYIDGKYNPQAAVDKWMEEQKKFERESVIIVIGFGNGMYIKSLIKEVKESVSILIYEPCINIFMKAMEEIDLEEMFGHGSITLILQGVNDDELKPIINRSITYDKLNILHHLTVGNYRKLFPEKIREVIEIEKAQITLIMRTLGTVLRFMDVNGSNFLNNITYLYNNYTTCQVKNLISEDIPSIIVAAGPSLNKNIEDLKAAKNKACIIATDTALKPLLNKGIMPDFIVIVDAKKPRMLFEHTLFSEIPMVLTFVVSKDPVNMHKGKKIFAWEGTVYERELFMAAKENSAHPENIDIVPLPTGGSVATTAYSFAKLLGSKTIILVGQDLAFTGNKTHADGTFKEKMDEIDIKSGKYIEVEDIYGNMIYTRYDYKTYLDWFNEEIPTSKDIKVIDATEGGAKITGTEILTLKEAIDRECICSVCVKELLDSVQPVFSEEKVKKIVKQFFNQTPERFYETKKKVEQGINYYDKMIKICSKKNFNVQEFLKLSKKVKKINNFINEDGVALMVVESIRNVDYALIASIHNTKDNERDERLEIARQGKVYLESMIPYIDKLSEIAENTVGKVGED